MASAGGHEAKQIVRIKQGKRTWNKHPIPSADTSR